jgi:Uma2 family endonuclease
MGQADLKKKYSVEEYFELEAISEERHEFYNGEIFAMAGATLNHNRLVQNVLFALRTFAKKNGCGVFSENVKLEALKDIYYPYPDVMFTCDPNDLKENLFIRRPSIIVEVLSESTARYDRDFKLRQYKAIRSLQYYMLVSQYEVRVELFSRLNDFQWQYEDFVEHNQTIFLEKADITLSIADIYEDILFIPIGESINH